MDLGQIQNDKLRKNSIIKKLIQEIYRIGEIEFWT